MWGDKAYMRQQCFSPSAYCFVKKTLLRYRHTSFYCTSIYCALQILNFSPIEGSWQPRFE